MIPRTLFAVEHEQFRDAVRRFIEREIMPHPERWEELGVVDRELWRKAGAAGLLCPNLPEAYGGFRSGFPVQRGDCRGTGARGNHRSGLRRAPQDMVATYIASFGSEEQKTRWLPKMVSGEVIGALGLTEPSAGSDLKGIKTRAVREGDEYVISGQKVYISNGQLCDVIVLACKMADPAAGAKGMSFILVEADRPGFRRGRNLRKIGLSGPRTPRSCFSTRCAYRCPIGWEKRAGLSGWR